MLESGSLFGFKGVFFPDRRHFKCWKVEVCGFFVGDGVEGCEIG